MFTIDSTIGVAAPLAPCLSSHGQSRPPGQRAMVLAAASLLSCVRWELTSVPFA